MPLPHLNQVVLVGRLSSEPKLRTLPSGDVVAEFQVTTRSAGRPTRSVPVAQPGTTSIPRGLAAGAEVVVLGEVNRRFHRAAGGSASRTEVIAQVVLPVSARVRIARALTTAAEAIVARTPE